MIPDSFSIFHLVLNRDVALRRPPPKWFLMQSTILMHPQPLVSAESQPAIVLKICSTEASPVLAKLYNAGPNFVYCIFLKPLPGTLDVALPRSKLLGHK